MTEESKAHEVRILVADDEEYVREGLSRWLHKAHGFQVDLVASGEEALEKVRQTRGDYYTVVLLDQSFEEGRDGLEILSDLKSAKPDLQVILFTGKEMQVGVEALWRGAYSYLIKPFANEELAATIQGLLQQDIALRRLAATAREILDVPLCLIWLLDETRERFRVQAWDGRLDGEYRQSVILDSHDPATQKFLLDGVPLALPEVTDPRRARSYRHAAEARQRDWRSLLSSPMICQGRVVGILDVYSIGNTREFDERDKRLIHAFASQAAAAVSSSLLYQRSQALAEINRLLSGTYDLKAMLDLILAKVLRLVGTDSGWLYVLDHENNELKIYASRGLQETQVHKARKLGQGVTGWVAQHGEAQLIPDVSKDKRYIAARRKNIRSEIVVPLKREDVVLGVLTAKSTHLDAFTEDDVTVLSTFATQAALAVERDKLARHTQEVSRLALSADPDELAGYVAGAVHDLTGLSVALWLMDEKRQELHIRAHRGLRKAYVRKATTPLEGSITGVALRGKRLLWRRDIQDDSQELNFYHMDEARQQGWHLFICVPLLAREGQPLGSLSLYGPHPQDCSQAQQTLVWTFANQAAMAFENIKLLRTERDLRRQAETLRQVSGTIGSQEEMSKITNRILDELGEIIEYKTASLQLIRGDYRTLLAGRGFDMETTNRLRPISKDPLIRRVVQGKEPLVLPYPSQDPDWGDLSDTSAIRSWIGVPLVYNQEVIGLLTADQDKPGFYRQDLSKPLSEFAARVVVDIRNVRIFDSAQRRIRDLAIINSVLELIATKLETKDLLQTIVSQIAQRLECTHCTIFFPEKKGGETLLKPEATYGGHPDLIWSRRFKSGEGLAGWVFRYGESLVLGDSREDSRFAAARVKQDKPRSMLVVPIRTSTAGSGKVSAHWWKPWRGRSAWPFSEQKAWIYCAKSATGSAARTSWMMSCGTSSRVPSS
jgi:GAF domain-containing protein